jgi:hypothetical protein
MSSNDRPRTTDRTLEERLRAAGGALREASAAQVDAATGLREILHGARAVADDQALPPADQPNGLAAPDAPLPGPSVRRLLRASQRPALVVNLLLVVALSVVLVRVAGSRQEPVPATPVAATTTVVPQATIPADPAATRPPATLPQASLLPTQSRVPDECVDATELADEIISRLNRNQRGNALTLALRDYSVASRACRREAAR